MNETNPTDPADTAAKPKAPTESATAPGALDGAKQKLASLAEKAKEHDFKGDAHKAAEGVKNLAENLKQRDFKEDARKAAEGVKNLKESLKTHDFKAELRDAFAETKKNPASIWRKPETLRPGKDLAVVGLAASVVLLLLLLVTSSSFLGLVCLVLGLGALLFSALGLKTEGRKLAVGGSVVGLLVLLCALGQTFGSSEGGDATDGEQAVASTDEDGTKAQTDKETASKTDTAPQKKKAAPMVGSKPKDYPVLVANEGKKTGKAEKIIAKADENASKLNSLNFFGFHTGMSLADFKTLREHYGLTNDQLWGYYNVENGDVHKICFTAKALDKIAHWPNNFDTVELHMLRYFGIVEWNNIKEVIEGEVDSIFQSDEDRLLFGDKANVPRQYRTADGVVATLFPTGWNIETREVFGLLDTKRQKSAAPIFRRFEQKNRMRNRLQELADQGIKVKMLQLPTGYEWLLREFDDGVWISAFPMTREEYTWLFCDVEYDKLSQKFKYDDADAIRKAIGENNGFADKFNELPPESKGTIARFREPFPEEMKKAFGSGIVDEKKYREIKQLRPLIKPSIPAIIVADEATSGQLNRTPMFIVHEPDRISEREWKRYSEERNNWIRAGKTDAELAALGYGLDAREWHEKRKDKALSAYVESEGGSIDGKLLFLPNYSKEEREAIRKAKEEAAKKAREEAEKIQIQKKTTIFEQKMVPENNARIDAVKPVLDAAKIETKEIEIEHGVRILMTRVDMTIGGKKIDWVSTFEVTEAQFAAADYDGIKMIELNNVPNGAAPHWFLSEQSADIFTRVLRARGWTFRVPSAEEWEFVAGESVQGSPLMGYSLSFRSSTLQDRIQGKRLDELVVNTRKSWERPKWNDVGNEKVVENENNFSPVGLAEPNYFGLYDLLGNAAEIHQPKDYNYNPKSDFGNTPAYSPRKDGALRLFATYTPPQPATTAPAPNPAPAAAKSDNAQ